MPKEVKETVLDKHRSSGAQEPRNTIGTLMKWVGGVTAILSLIIGLYQITQLLADVRERQRQVSELHKVGKAQQAAGDYESAWASFEQAVKIAETGGQLAKLTGSLSEEQRRSRNAQEDLAMAWVEDVRVPQGKTISDIVNKLISVLTRGAAGASSVRKADLLAHLGWAYFLKARDYSSELDNPVRLNIEQHYQEALEIDPGNPYAHVHWGHLVIWERKKSDDAIRHFSAAVASGRALPYVRQVQLAALHNFPDTEDGFLRAVNDMVKNDEKIDATTRSNVLGIYSFALRSDKDFRRLIAAVPPTEQIAMIRALFYDAEFDPSKIPTREASVAMLQEAAGLRDEAVKTWLAMRSGLPTDSVYTTRADASIKRLSKK
jgi:tetratricopeptide (TPR) repeat protein